MQSLIRGLAALVTLCLAVLAGGSAFAAPKETTESLLRSAGVAAPASGALKVTAGTVEVDGLPVRIQGAGKGNFVGARHTWAVDGIEHVAQRTAEGAQLLSVLESASSPRRISYDFPGHELQLLPDGSVAVVDPTGNGGLVAQIEKPWAKDAEGRATPTRYEVRGSVLTQIIRTTDATAFPVVADPSVIGCGFLRLCLKFNRSETSRIGDATVIGVGATVATLCGLIPWTPWYVGALKAACAGYVAANFAAIRGNAASARSSGRCLALRFTPNGIPLGSLVVTC